MSAIFNKGDKVIYKVGFLAHPSIIIEQLDKKVTIAIAPNGNKTNDTADYDKWPTLQAPINKIKHYTW